MLIGQAISHTTAHAESATERPRPRLLAWRVADTSTFIPPSFVRVAAAALQLLVLIAAGLTPAALLAMDPVHWSLVLIASLLTVALLDAAGLDDRAALEGGAAACGRHVLPALVLAVAAGVVAAIAIGPGARGTGETVAVWLVLSAIGLMLARLALGAMVRRWAARGRLDRRAVIYGSGPACRELIETIEADATCDLTIVGTVDERGSGRSGGDVLGYPRLGTLEDAIALARCSRIDIVLISLPLTAEHRVLDILARLSVLPAEVCHATGSDAASACVGRLPVRTLAGMPIGSWGLLAKSALDRTLAALALVVLSPLLAAIAVAVRLDSRGPVLFRQQRYGFNNELIEVFKFRSMYVDCTDATARRLVTRGDARVTRVGRFIRKTSLDELPQLINVLRGDLSLVGPRPHAVHARANDRLYGEVVGRYFARHKVKPGITGWAQVNGWRGETDTEEKLVRRIEHDLYYIENWSLLLDLEILARTPRALLETDNAY